MEFVGRGLYDLPQAARLLRIHYNTLRYWIGETGHPSLVMRSMEPEKLLTFSELMELYFVKMFKDENVSLQTIRRAASEAAKRFKTDHPFAVQRFDTDGKSIFATLIDRESNKEIVEELRHGQLVFATVVRPFYRKLKYDGPSVGEFWPLGKGDRIVLDPMRKHGQPIDAETGLPVETILDALRGGGGQDAKTVADWFDIPLEAVQAAIRFDHSLAA